MCYRPALTRTLLPPSQRRYSSVEADAAPTLKIKGGRPYNCRQHADRMSRAPDRPRHPQLRGRSGSGSTAIFSAGKLAHTPLLCCHLEGACPWPMSCTCPALQKTHSPTQGRQPQTCPQHTAHGLRISPAAHLLQALHRAALIAPDCGPGQTVTGLRAPNTQRGGKQRRLQCAAMKGQKDGERPVETAGNVPRNSLWKPARLPGLWWHLACVGGSISIPSSNPHLLPAKRHREPKWLSDHLTFQRMGQLCPSRKLQGPKPPKRWG